MFGMVKHITRILLASVSALSAVAVAFTQVPARADPVPAAAAGKPGLRWGACPDPEKAVDQECASIEVPVDWAKPHGRRITLVLGRLTEKEGPGAFVRTGSVIVNPGGPGASGIDYLPYMLPSFAKLRQRMHIVTWDTRGYPGRSTSLPAVCGQLVRPRTPPYPRDQAEFEALAAHNRELADACRDEDPELFDHMDSASHARDLDAIRRALREPRLNFLGSSYGGVFAQAYARLFPTRVRTMVLDGTANQSARNWDQELDSIARDNERTMRRFFDWCAGDTACALHGRDLPRVWQALVARADRTPIPAPKVDATYDGRDLRGLAGPLAMRGPDAWPTLALAIREAEAGDASRFAPSPARPYPMVGTPGLTECLEFPRPVDFARLSSTVRRLDRIAPNTGASFPLIQHITTCVGWPTPVTNPPRPLPTHLPPLLGAGTWTDYPGTDRVVSQVPGSTTIYHDGPGHTLYGTGNACVIALVDRYFTTRRLPPPGTRC
jgi:pimeloyl-ACP methyl ester carboxylesterase